MLGKWIPAGALVAASSILAPACAAEGDTETAALLASDLDPSPSTTLRCGGLAGLRCPSGYLCADDPEEGCGPATDCMGICVPPYCASRALHASYISMDPGECARMRFTCAEDMVPFFDACGCGCESAEPGDVL